MPAASHRCPTCDGDLGVRTRCLTCDAELLPGAGRWHLSGVVGARDGEALTLALADGRSVRVGLDASLPADAVPEPGARAELLVEVRRAFDHGGLRQAAREQVELVAHVVASGPGARERLLAELERLRPAPSTEGHELPWPAGLRVRARRVGAGWQLRLKLRAADPMHTDTFLVALVVVGGSLGLAFGTWRGDRLVFAGVAATCLFMLAIVGLPRLLRDATVLLDARGLALQHGPIPLLRRRVVPAVDAVAVYTTCAGEDAWAIEVLDRAGRRTPLLDLPQVSGLPALLLTARLLEAALGLLGRPPVEGESVPGLPGRLPDPRRALERARRS